MKNKISDIKKFLQNKKNKITLVKSSLAITTTLLIAGCGVSNQVKPTKTKPQTSIEHIDDNTITTTEKTVETTTETQKPSETNPTEKPSQNDTTQPTSENKTTTNNEEQTSENKVTTSSTTNKNTTTTKTTTSSASSSNRPVTTTQATVNNTTTTKVTTERPTTTTKTTTSKPVTTTTTTTTQQPIQQTNYKIEDIAKNSNAFECYAHNLNLDLMKGSGRPTSYGNVSFGGRESCVALAMLNDGLISDSVLREVFENYNIDDFKHGAEYLYTFCETENLFGTDVDFSKYTIDKEIGVFLNNLDNSYRNGAIDAFINDKFVVGNISDKCAKHTAIWALTSSYDTKNNYISVAEVEVTVMDKYIGQLNKTVHGKSYTK